MSTAIEIKFPAGQYHALPWDRHVNEAAAEWPPSPLRLLRALIAIWHRKADRERFSEKRLRSLIEALAGEQPVYRLPRASLAHTRHFMPIRKGRTERRTLIYDAFLRVDPDDELLVVWPNTTLDAEQRELLEHLLERLGYVGRAESWAECCLLDPWDALPDCGPEASTERWLSSSRSTMEPFDLPVVLPPEEYASWRTEQIEDLGLEKPRLKKEKRLRATLPERLIDALRLETGDVRDVGWSRMPATDRTTYLRPENCFRPTTIPPRRADAPERRATTVRFALLRTKRRNERLGPPLPRLEDAIKIGELVRVAAMSWFKDKAVAVPPEISGHDMPGDEPHQHAFYLPEDTTGDGRVDHVLVHAEAEFDDIALEALAGLERIWLDDSREWRLLLEGYGDAEAFRRSAMNSGPHPYLRRARTWESVTPYLHPWFRKKTFTVEDQIVRELTSRGLPEPNLTRLSTVEVGGTARRSVHFHRFRNRRGLTQPDTRGSFWRLEFPAPVLGPIALGFGCHYGLGMFSAAEAPQG